MYYCYVLMSEKEKNWIYVGSTIELKSRLSLHERGKVESTKFYRPLKLAAYIAVPDEHRARELEKYFKVGSGKAILKKRILGEQALKSFSKRSIA
ncbi:GIY-YIG nuclease family protein [Candidatus Uhrbacteria bacterium]|nr:GIY-YIG nuclease family protein [Candidatus Uhrbacteria bacterium]